MWYEIVFKILLKVALSENAWKVNVSCSLTGKKSDEYVADEKLKKIFFKVFKQILSDFRTMVLNQAGCWLDSERRTSVEAQRISS